MRFCSKSCINALLTLVLLALSIGGPSLCASACAAPSTTHAMSMQTADMADCCSHNAAIAANAAPSASRHIAPSCLTDHTPPALTPAAVASHAELATQAPALSVIALDKQQLQHPAVPASTPLPPISRNRLPLRL